MWQNPNTPNCFEGCSRGEKNPTGIDKIIVNHKLRIDKHLVGFIGVNFSRF
jgi:hypothetical protein